MVGIEMPKYVCHKQVWALKIKDVQVSGEGENLSCILVFEQADTYGPLSVGYDFYVKHKPQPGGYYVVYEDGYKSYSPAPAFENGYMPITSVPNTGYTADSIGQVIKSITWVASTTKESSTSQTLARFLRPNNPVLQSLTMHREVIDATAKQIAAGELPGVFVYPLFRE